MAALCAALLTALLAASCAAEGGGPSAVSSSADVSSSVAVSSAPESTPPLPQPPVAGLSPLTGLPLPEGVAAGQRPVSVVVANNIRSLPQRGLAGAEILYEMPVENGDTRLMALYAGPATVPAVGPVRATQDQFVQFALPANSIHVHIGASQYASNLLNTLAYQDVDGLYTGATAFTFDVQRTLPKAAGGRLNENCWYTDAALLAQGMASSGVLPEGEAGAQFRFAETPRPLPGDAADIRVEYSDIVEATFQFYPDNALYAKTFNGLIHADESGEWLTFTNLVFLFCPITQKADGPLAEYDLRGGTGYYFSMGGVQPITWKKGGPKDPLRLYDEGGAELLVNKGRSYVGLVPQDREPNFQHQTRQQYEAALAALEAEAQKAAEEQAAAEQAAAEQAAAEQAAAEQAAAEQAAAEQAAAEQTAQQATAPPPDPAAPPA